MVDREAKIQWFQQQKVKSWDYWGEKKASLQIVWILNTPFWFERWNGTHHIHTSVRREKCFTSGRPTARQILGGGEGTIPRFFIRKWKLCDLKPSTKLNSGSRQNQSQHQTPAEGSVCPKIKPPELCLLYCLWTQIVSHQCQLQCKTTLGYNPTVLTILCSGRCCRIFSQLLSLL